MLLKQSSRYYYYTFDIKAQFRSLKQASLLYCIALTFVYKDTIIMRTKLEARRGKLHIQNTKHYQPLTTLNERQLQQYLGTITTSASITIIIIIILIVEIYVILLNVFILYMVIIVYNPNMKGLISTLSRYAYLICRSIHAFSI